MHCLIKYYVQIIFIQPATLGPVVNYTKGGREVMEMKNLMLPPPLRPCNNRMHIKVLIHANIHLRNLSVL